MLLIFTILSDLFSLERIFGEALKVQLQFLLNARARFYARVRARCMESDINPSHPYPIRSWGRCCAAIQCPVSRIGLYPYVILIKLLGSG